MSIFQPTSSFIIADMKSLRLEIQLAPVMQLYIVASTEEKGKMSGESININIYLYIFFIYIEGEREGGGVSGNFYLICIYRYIHMHAYI